MYNVYRGLREKAYCMVEYTLGGHLVEMGKRV